MKWTSEVVVGKNGMSFHRQIKNDPYTSQRELKEKDDRIKKLKEEVAKRQKELKEETNKGIKESANSREPERRINENPVRKGLEEKGFHRPFMREGKTHVGYLMKGNAGGQLNTATEGHTDAPNGRMCGEDHPRVDLEG